MSVIDERRKSLRTDVDEMAYISSSGSSTRCRIVNLSEDGAALDVPDASYIPNSFHLMTERDRIVRTCRYAVAAALHVPRRRTERLAREQNPSSPTPRCGSANFSKPVPRSG